MTFENLNKCGSLEEIKKEGFMPFSLGPLYVYAGVKHDLINEFGVKYKEKHGKSVYGTTIRFERPIINNLGDWSFVLNLIDANAFPFFSQWLFQAHFRAEVDNDYFEVRLADAAIIDPLKFDAGKEITPTGLLLYVPSGTKWLIQPRYMNIPYAAAPNAIDLIKIAPEVDVQEMGRAVLKGDIRLA